MLVGKSLEGTKGKGRVGQTGSREDQTGMPWSFQPHTCKQALQEIPLLALPMAARHCHPAGVAAHLIIFTESPALAPAVYRGQGSPGEPPHGAGWGGTWVPRHPPGAQGSTGRCPEHPPQLRAAAALPGSRHWEVLLADGITGMTEVPLFRSTKTGWVR